MDMSGTCLDTIENAIAEESSPLARALGALSAIVGQRGTCLLLEHEEFGETLIADSAWTLERTETLRHREDFAVVDLRQNQGFTRFAVLMQRVDGETVLDRDACALTMAALDVTAALADIAASYATPVGPAVRISKTPNDAPAALA